MASRIHMQDQVKDRIHSIMQEKPIVDSQTCSQNLVLALIVLVFLTFGLSW